MKYILQVVEEVIKYLVIAILATSCTTSGPSGLFGKKSLHEQYGDKIKSAGLNETALGRQWFAAAEQSLAAPMSVNLPYSETGYFPADEAKAVGIIFQGRRGERLTINLTKKPESGFAIYLDLWQAQSSGDNKPKFLLSGDSTSAIVNYDVDNDNNYILRLQPELLKGGEYTLSISTGPSLAFPITPKVKANIGSFWGADRDAGIRKHEGIDIFAPRRTAAVAAANGVVSRVTENKLGGKVVFFNPENKDYTLYYAHLDEQLVQSGQLLKTGDTIGLVGNTGNARTTAPHLHFGIYTSSGAINPFPFVNKEIKSPSKVTAPLTNLDKWVRTNKATRIVSEPSGDATIGTALEANTLLRVEAATAGWYKVALPGGEKGFVASSHVLLASAPLRTASIKALQPLLDQPSDIAARKTVLSAGQAVKILGSYKDYYFVSKEDIEGWLPKKVL